MSDSFKSFNSRDYWVERYKSGGNSGSGSYGRLAIYKANFVNELVHNERIKSVVEFGCGDGHQASLFSIQHYTGVDVSKKMVERSREAFASKTKWNFVDSDSFSPERKYGLSMSLDVIYHLVEDSVFDQYMRSLFQCSKRFVLIYSSDHDSEIGATSPHVRHRNYSQWVQENQKDWVEKSVHPNPFPRTAKSNPRHTAIAYFRLFQRVSQAKIG